VDALVSDRKRVGCFQCDVIDGCVQQSTRYNMWTEITRPKYERKGSGYSSNLSDVAWALIAPRLP
jgi:hypothetical protein